MEYTAKYLKDYISKIKKIEGGQTSQVDAAWRELGYINASAFKGYRKLSYKEAKYNWLIYSIKNKAIRILVEHTDNNNIATYGGVLFIYTLEGIQLSFHLGKLLDSSYNDIHKRFCKKVKWDGVQNSYTYDDINEYNQARAKYEQKCLEDKEKEQQNSVLIHNEIKSFFKHHNTRKTYGLPIKKTEWLKLCDKVNAIPTDIVLIESIIRMYGITKYELVSKIAHQINRNLPLYWNHYHFNE